MLQLNTLTWTVLTSTLGIFATLITGAITVFVSTFEA